MKYSARHAERRITNKILKEALYIAEDAFDDWGDMKPQAIKTVKRSKDLERKNEQKARSNERATARAAKAARRY